MFLDSKDGLRLSINKIYEPAETELVKKEIKEGNVVVDVGAHIGYYTLIFAKLVGANGTVFAFEPDPIIFPLLKKNVEINEYKNVILIQKGVSNIQETVQFNYCQDDKGRFMTPGGNQLGQIDFIRLDDYFKNYDGRIDFIKMDIDGADGKALQGMSGLLSKNKNIKIVTEFWPIGLKRSGMEPAEYLKLLFRHGFTLYDIKKQEKIEPDHIARLLETYSLDKGNHTNLFCVRVNP